MDKQNLEQEIKKIETQIQAEQEKIARAERRKIDLRKRAIQKSKKDGIKIS